MNSNILEFNSVAKHLLYFDGKKSIESLGQLMMSDFQPDNITDVGICCANINFYESVARTTADLFHEGAFPLIISSGGVIANGTNILESRAMKDIMLDFGVPEECILLENRSQHSKDNVVYSKAILEDMFPDLSINSVFGVGVKSSACRFLATFVEHWPEADISFKGANDYNNVDSSNWSKYMDSARHVWDEVDKIIEYADRGDVSKSFAECVQGLRLRIEADNPPDKVVKRLAKVLSR